MSPFRIALTSLGVVALALAGVGGYALGSGASKPPTPPELNVVAAEKVIQNEIDRIGAQGRLVGKPAVGQAVVFAGMEDNPVFFWLAADEKTNGKLTIFGACPKTTACTFSNSRLFAETFGEVAPQ